MVGTGQASLSLPRSALSPFTLARRASLWRHLSLIPLSGLPGLRLLGRGVEIHDQEQDKHRHHQVSPADRPMDWRRLWIAEGILQACEGKQGCLARGRLRDFGRRRGGLTRPPGGLRPGGKNGITPCRLFFAGRGQWPQNFRVLIFHQGLLPIGDELGNEQIPEHPNFLIFS